MATVRKIAPMTPPRSEEKKAAERARAPSPRFAMGKPSRTVDCEELLPGIPMRTEGNVSAVGVTAIMPIIKGKAWDGSIPNTKGKSTAIPALPPSAGSTPMMRPT